MNARAWNARALSLIQGARLKQPILVRFSRRELGRIINRSRQMATPELQTLGEQGAVKVEGKSIIVYRSFSGSERNKSGNPFTNSTITGS